ncbi:hypothetical protein [Glycomyces buryatensis]|uniref:Uncharacterized protein n=1 Tax=Glycomyces buryatensis TaxID=2570927 RepID=A0A4S8QF33_9ACTN|nr:hypothetical protein [Glycomyces buryatensis]THV42970.1 hypothetical protein FAB82_03180 [Glycomyces buryatensis]
MAYISLREIPAQTVDGIASGLRWDAIVPAWRYPARDKTAFLAKLHSLQTKPSPVPRSKVEPQPRDYDLPSLGRLQEEAFGRFLAGSEVLARAHDTEMNPGRWERVWTNLRQGRIAQALSRAFGLSRRRTHVPVAKLMTADATTDADEPRGRLRGSGGWLSGPALPDQTPPVSPPQAAGLDPSKIVHTPAETERDPYAPGFHTAPDGTQYLNFPLCVTAEPEPVEGKDIEGEHPEHQARSERFARAVGGARRARREQDQRQVERRSIQLAGSASLFIDTWERAFDSQRGFGGATA